MGSGCAYYLYSNGKPSKPQSTKPTVLPINPTIPIPVPPPTPAAVTPPPAPVEEELTPEVSERVRQVFLYALGGLVCVGVSTGLSLAVLLAYVWKEEGGASDDESVGGIALSVCIFSFVCA